MTFSQRHLCLSLKVDELIEQERQVKSAMSSRAGVMALMLHSTFNHDVVSLIGTLTCLLSG